MGKKGYKIIIVLLLLFALFDPIGVIDSFYYKSLKPKDNIEYFHINPKENRKISIDNFKDMKIDRWIFPELLKVKYNNEILYLSINDFKMKTFYYYFFIFKKYLYFFTILFSPLILIFLIIASYRYMKKRKTKIIEQKS